MPIEANVSSQREVCYVKMAALRVNQCLVLTFLLLICGIQYVMFSVVFKHSIPFSRFIGLRGADDRISGEFSQVHTAVPSPTANQINNQHQKLRNVEESTRGKVAVILPYLGKSLPSWFDLFALSTTGSSSLVDWFIFITEAPRKIVPPNVHLIRVTRQDIFQRLARLDAAYGNTSEGRQKLESYFQHIMDVRPYILVEMKPALGFLFSDYVSSYSHWAYADLDLLVGRLHHQITPDLLHKYDIITLSFGDNNRLYMRGQFTLHKNTPALSNLWRGCDYLSKIGTRLQSFFEHKKGWDFHSAEGCYSKVVANTPNISVLYVPIQFSDAFRAPLEAKETVVVGAALHRCYLHPITDAVIASSYSNEQPLSNALLREPSVGAPLERVPLGTEHCSYWIDPRDQVCTQYVAGNATITIQDGQMTARTESRFTTDGCREASIAHFQGGKRGYFHFTTRLPPPTAHAMVITESGIVPLTLPHAGTKPFSKVYTTDALLTGRVRREGLRVLKQSTLKQAELFGREKAAPGAPNQEYIATAYCVEFSEDLKKCTRFLLEHDITVLAVPSKEIEPGASSASPITMISVGWLHEYMSGVYTPLLDSWAGTTVLVLAVGADSEFSDFAHHRTDVTIVAVRICAGEDKKNATLRLPDKTLFNIGLDAARTEVVILMPNHMRFPATEQTRADLREMEPHLQRAGSPVAIVIPVVSMDADIQEDACRSDQPQAFKFLGSKSELSSRTPLAFNAQQLLKPRTVMMPVLFNTSGSPHGAGFVRFPEELNGVGCYGASIIRILAGAGYSPQWPPPDKIVHAEISAQITSARRIVSSAEHVLTSRADEFAYDTECGCARSAKSEKLTDMVNLMNKYFLKAVQLRQSGLQKVYSRDPFGRTFDEDQQKAATV